MTTLGALLAGLVLLLLLLGVLVWMQRRARRGPEQPRTVADLVRMREAVRPEADDAEASSEVSEREPDPAEAPQPPVAAAEVAEPAPAPEPTTGRCCALRCRCRRRTRRSTRRGPGRPA